jgi:hypothetical protein
VRFPVNGRAGQHLVMRRRTIRLSSNSPSWSRAPGAPLHGSPAGALCSRAFRRLSRWGPEQRAQPRGYALSLRYGRPVNQATCRRAGLDNHTSSVASTAGFGPPFLHELRNKNRDAVFEGQARLFYAPQPKRALSLPRVGALLARAFFLRRCCGRGPCELSDRPPFIQTTDTRLCAISSSPVILAVIPPAK